MSSFIKRFFTPEFVGSYKLPLTEELTPRIYIFRNQTSPPEVLDIKNFYPFMTLQDLKTIIYMSKGDAVDFYPTFQALMIPLDIGEETPKDALHSWYRSADFSWMKPGSTSDADVYNMKNPFTRAQVREVDERFMGATAPKVNDFASRGRASYEVLLPLFQGARPVFHLFLFKDVISLINPELRQSEREWVGRIKPYFPELQITQPLNELTAQQSLIIGKRTVYVRRTLQLMNRLDLLLDGDVNLYPVALAGIKFLRLVWVQADEEAPSLESLFYQLPVTAERPFLRILPNDNVAVTKIRLAGVLKIPDISDPRLLLQWAQEKNPTPDKDFMFSKTVIRKTVGSQPALYGTLRLFEERSGDFILMPPKQLRKLDPRSDLRDFPQLLVSALTDTPLAGKTPDIGEASLICGIRMPTDAKPITKMNLRKRLPAFASLFQEISSLPGEQPLVMLRYKAVSNFANEDRLYAFLTQLVNRRIIKGDIALHDLVAAVGEEFQLSDEEASAKVRKWWDARGTMSLAVPETKDYILTYNTGTDIGIFAQHPFYSFHIYRVDSIQSLERILTALSLLLSAEDSQLFTPERVITEHATAEEALVPIAPGSVMPVPVTVTPAVEDDLPEDADVAGDAEFEGIDADLMFDVGDNELLDLGDAFQEEVQEAVGSVNVATMVAKDEEKPAVELRGLAVAAATAASPEAKTVTAAVTAAATPKTVAAKENNSDEESEEEDGKRTYAKFLAKKLQEADDRLFVYKSPNPAVKIKKYVTMCQATETRQPAVLNQEQYERMRDIYRDDDITFLIFPLERDDPSELPEEGRETYTILRYGSDPLHQNYYLCCEFFCIRDYILVRESDFYSTQDRAGKAKPGESSPGKKDRGSCPFCHGLLIHSLKAPQKDEVVIQRKIKQKSKEDKRHLWVGFLKDTFHPEGFYLPCCFTGKKEVKKDKKEKPVSSVAWDKSLEDKKHLIRISDRQFEHIRAAAQTVPEEREGEDDDETERVPVSAASITAVPVLDYAVTLSRAHKKYIVGPEKFPLKMGELEGPQIGLLPAILDSYFSQNPTDFVSRDFNRMELKPESEGFLRIGVENRSSYLPDSFLAAIAPFIDYRNNAAEVKARFMEVITPKIFLFLNFGNLVLEFYDPSFPNPKDGEIRKWSSEELQVDMTEQNKDVILRLWKSYNNFLVFLKSTSTLKEYRQFAQVLALPSLLTPRGIVFVILDVNEEEKVEVRCPPYGYDVDRYSDSDVGFLLHHHTGIWEPIFFTDNRPAKARFEETHTYILRFERSTEASWPPIVRQRVREFIKRCSGPSRGEFTSQSRIDTMALVSVSRALQLIKQDVFGVVRDSYNHVVALTYRSDPSKSFKAGLVAFPVVDDGTYIQKWVHFDWDDFPKAHLEDVIAWYRANVEKQFTAYKGYKVVRTVKSRGTKKYEAVQLANGIFIPAGEPRDAASITLPFVEVQEMEWMINRKIIFSNDAAPSHEQLMKAEESELDEIFEHLRLTFSKWLESEEAGSDLRAQLEKIIFRKDLPLFEKRKRLQIHLENTVMGWIDSEKMPNENGEISSLIRADCRMQMQPYCTGRCVWRQKESDAAGRCYLHVPSETRLGTRNVNGPQLLFLRLIEELLRFPERRRQLLREDVPTMVKMTDAIRIKDQWILPETSLAWADLLRLDWVQSGKERKLFFEEMSRTAEVPATVAATVAKTALKTTAATTEAPTTAAKTEAIAETEAPATTTTTNELPQVFVELFGEDDPKVKALFLYKVENPDETQPLRPYLSLLGLGPADLGLPEDALALTKDAIKKLVTLARRPILQFHPEASMPDDTYAYGLFGQQKSEVPFIFIIDESGPALVSTSPTSFQPVTPEDMPSELFEAYDMRTAIRAKV